MSLPLPRQLERIQCRRCHRIGKFKMATFGWLPGIESAPFTFTCYLNVRPVRVCVLRGRRHNTGGSSELRARAHNIQYHDRTQLLLIIVVPPSLPPLPATKSAGTSFDAG